MTEWFNNIWEWILINKDNVLACINSTDFVATMATVIALFKTIRTTKANTLSIDDVNMTFKKQQDMSTDLEGVKADVNEIKLQVIEIGKSVNTCMEKIIHTENTVRQLDDELLAKANAMLEVQSIVYSTIKDDNIRTGVNSILVAAKHSDAKSKAKLQSELDALRNELKAKNAELAETVSKMVEKVVTDVPADAVPAVNEHIRRY